MTGFYGQISKIGVLPVTGDWILRAEFKNRRFARNG
nr:vitamin B12-binding protein [Ligilactobacillus ruminis]